MGLTQLQSLELNKRVDKILHAPSNAPAGGQQLEIAFVADLSGGIEELNQSIKDAVTSLKSHDKIFQNVRSNLVYWGNGKIILRVTPMSFIQMGKAFEGIESFMLKILLITRIEMWINRLILKTFVNISSFMVRGAGVFCFF